MDGFNESQAVHDLAVTAAQSCRNPCSGNPVSISTTIQESGLSGRRCYNLVCFLVAILFICLYWINVVDWRVCSAPSAVVAGDPWLDRFPSSPCAQAWPCSGSQLAKLIFLMSSPVSLLRGMISPVGLSELYFLASFCMMMIGGLDILAITRRVGKHNSVNCTRLAWSVTSGAQLRTFTILIRLLRRQQPPRPESGCVSAPGERRPSTAALTDRLRHQALGPLPHLLLVKAVGRLYGGGGARQAALPRQVLVRLQAASGLLAVCASGLQGSSLLCRHRASGVATGKSPDERKGGKAGSGLHELLGNDSRGIRRELREEGGSQVVTAERRDEVRRRADEAGVQEGIRAAAAAPVLAAAAAAAAASAAPSHSRPAGNAGGSSRSSATDGCSRREERLLRLCQRLCVADTGARRPGASLWRRRFTNRTASTIHPRHPSGVSSSSSIASSASSSSSHAISFTNSLGILGACSSSSSSSSSSAKWYRESLTWMHVHMKLLGLDPSQLSSGIAERLADAVAESVTGAAVTGVSVRSGCVEVHLDLVRNVEPAAPVAAPGAAAAAAAAPAAGVGGMVAALGLPQELGPATMQPGPASAEQQGLASCILQALGLPPGYHAAVRAQVGVHLLTLTPAAGSGGGWAVLGTRRMQALEVPWVTKVEPPAVVAPPPPPPAAGSVAAAAADPLESDLGCHRTAIVHMTIAGSSERLAMAHNDPDLEVLALFEGAFLSLSDLQWGPLEESPYAATGSGDATVAAAVAPADFAGARLARLPPSLALSRRVLTATLLLPAGRTGAVSLLLMRRGTAGQSHFLLLLQREDAAVMGEVAALQERAHATDGPPVASVTNFIRDLGHWLQYRDFWYRKTAAGVLATRGGSGGCAAAAATTGSPRTTGLGVRSSWVGSWLSWRGRSGDSRGGGVGVGGLRLLQLKSQGCTCVGGEPLLAQAAGGVSSVGDGRGVASAALYPQVRLAQLSDSDLLDQDDLGSGAVSGRGPESHRPPGDHRPATQHYGSPGAASPSVEEEQQRLALRSLPAFGQPTYEKHMLVTRRSLLEFALEQRCAAVAAALLEPAPVPTQEATAAVAAYGAASYLAELAESSRTASPDGLTLLHRAVRGGDAATVDAVLRAARRAAEAAAAVRAAGLQPFPAPLRRVESGDDNDDTAGFEGGSAATAAAGGTHVRTAGVPDLCDWDMPDAYGITPLHYLAVLDDGGALARHVLSSRADALARWDVCGPDIPSPASFAALNGLVVDVEELRRQRQLEQQWERQHGADSCSSGALGSPGTMPLLRAALWGFPCGDLERRYQSFARASSQAGALPAWLLLLLHMAACAGGVLQVFTQPSAWGRRGIVPVVALQSGCLLLAACRCRPMSRVASCSTWRAVAWTMHVLALAVLLARSIDHVQPAPMDPMSWARLGVYGEEDAGVCAAGAAAGGGCGGSRLCCITGPRHALLALHHVLAAVTVPYMVPSALFNVLAVQAVEAAAYVLLLARRVLGCAGFAAAAAVVAAGGQPGCCAMAAGGGEGHVSAMGGLTRGIATMDGGLGGCGNLASLGAALIGVGSAAAHLAGGLMLRGLVSALVILIADVRSRAAFICSTSTTSSSSSSSNRGDVLGNSQGRGD